MAKAIIQVNWADGRVVERVFDGETVVIGSGAEANFLITNAPEVAPAHLLIIPRDDECWASSVRDARVPVMYGGKIFENGKIPWGAEIDIGSLTVRVLRSGEAKKSKIRLIAMGAVIALACYFLLPDEASGLPTTNAAPPDLFGALSGSCPEEQRAAARASEALAAADAREIRYAFDRAEGVAAAGQLRVAELCGKRASETRLVEDVHGRRSALEARINSDYKALRITLRRAMARDDFKTIAQTANQLRRLVGHRPGRYLAWLGELERRAIDEVARQEKEAKEGLST